MRDKRNLFFVTIVVLLGVGLNAPATHAQVVHDGNQTGLPPFGSFHGSNFDVVSLNNGNLHIEIPIASLPQRGRSFVWKFVYDIPTFEIIWYPPPDPYVPGFWVVTPAIEKAKWRLENSFSWSLGYVFTHEECTGVPQNPQYGLYSNWAVWAPDGTKHALPLRRETTNPCFGNTLVGPALDGTGVFADITDQGNQKVWLKDGTQVLPLWRDANGNLASGAQDMLMRQGVRVENDGPDKLWIVKNSEGQELTFRLTFRTIPVNTGSSALPQNQRACSSWHTSGTCYEYTANWQVPDKLILPNLREYQFHWSEDGFGDLIKIDLPTGGFIEYTYLTRWDDPPGIDGRDAPLTARRAVTYRIVTADGQFSEWNYAYDGGETKITHPQDHNSVRHESVHVHQRITVNNVLSTSHYETQVRVYEGSASGGMLLRTTNKEYTGELNPVTSKLTNVRVIRETTTLEDGKVTKRETDYETFVYPYQGDGGCPNPGCTATRMNILEAREYLYGSGAPGALARKTTNTYLHTGNSNYLNRNIVDRLKTTVVRNGAGQIVAQTEFEYDNYTEGIQSFSVVQHDTANYGSGFIYRGNVTATKRWRNTDAAWLTTRNQYDLVGNIRKTTDPLNHSTTFDYADAWQQTSCAPAGQGRAYLKSSTNPLGHVTSHTYKSCTGQMATTTDANNRTTTVSYDQYGRPDVTNFPDGGQVDLDYDDTDRWVRTGRKKDTSGGFIYSRAHYDQLGRVWREELCEDGSPGCSSTIKTDTTYDQRGFKATVTNPYRTGAEPTSGVTTFHYDALGRVSRVISPSGGDVATEYLGNRTTVTDQAGKQRRSFTDALGRLVEVHEPTEDSGGGGGGSPTPGTGYVDIAGSLQSTTGWEEICDWYWNGWDWEWYCWWQQTTIWDDGGVSITVNGQVKSTTYGQGSTATSVANALASAINADSGYPVTASLSGTRINLTSKTTGSASNYPLSAASWTNKPQHFTQPSFTATPSGSTLTGGSDTGGGGGFSNPAVTLYTYDTLDNLTCVVQKGTDTAPFTSCAAAPAAWRPRSFVYNSVGQLLQATNPESGTVNYTYDADGNLLTKTGPKPNQTNPAVTVTTTFAYDALHRLTGKSYNDGTPTATYTYDAASVDGLGILNPVGRLVKSATSNTRTVMSYDEMGRVKVQWQCTPANCGSGWFQTTYAYNLGGDLTSQTIPMGYTLTYTYGTGGRLTQLASSWSGAQHPGTLASGFVYHPHGAVKKMLLGNGLTETMAFNNRLQPCRINVNSSGAMFEDCSAQAPAGNKLHLAYGFTDGGGANNGNVISWAAAGEQAFNRTYTYDELNRLKTMAAPGETCSGLTWEYDIWGNRKEQRNTGGGGSVCGEHFPTILPSNRIAELGYDAAGNVLSDPANNASYTYDAENRMISTTSTLGSATYVYDADGRRVRKTANGVTTDYIYNATGQVVAERQGSAWTKGYVYLGAQLLAQYDKALGAQGATTYFAHKDHVGSTRLLTTHSGAAHETYDYLPFGESLSSGTTTTHQFTGHERDSETGLDYMKARYYSSGYGRFHRPDPLKIGGDAVLRSDPQSWNAYTYVINNPLNAVDPDGLDYYLIGGDRCGKDVQCDKEGFVVDDKGNRVVITDEQVQSGEVQVTLGENGVATITTDQGTFSAYFFDRNMVDGTAIVPQLVVLGTIQWIDALPDAARVAEPGVNAGMISMLLPAVAVGGGAHVSLAGEGVSAITMALRPVVPSPSQISYVGRIFAQGGRKALEKSIRSWEKRLAKHIADLDKYSRRGGHTSSVESEIRNFQALIKAAKDLLGKTP